MFAAAARLHKRQFEAHLAGAGVEVEVRQRPPRAVPTTTADKVLGRRQDVVADAPAGPSTFVRAVVSDAAMATGNGYGSTPAEIVSIGKVEALDLILRCALTDVLVDPDKPYGKTVFDGAKDVLVAGTPFEVRATDRTGLPPVGPYILWVALRKAD